VRLLVLLALAAGPLAFGAVHEPVFVPLLAALLLAGSLSWAHGHWARSHGHAVPGVAGWRTLLALHGLVLFQLLPLPPGLLGLLSPGSYRFHAGEAGVLEAWRSVSVAPGLTLRGLAFLAGMTLLYATVFREFRAARWRHRLVYVLVATGFAITVVALLQARSADPARIYGWWKPQHAWAVFGPYVNRNHFAGFLVIALPLALGVTLQRGQQLRRAWTARRRGWLALGDPPGSALLRWLAISMFLLVGLLLAGSRAGVAGLVTSALALLLLPRRRAALLGTALALAGVLGLALVWADFGAVIRGFAGRGIHSSRFVLWADTLRLFPDYPALGYGLNAMGPAYRPLQTYMRSDAIAQAHNEYLQLLLDLGLIGAGLAFSLLGRLFWTAFRVARESPVSLGVTAAVLGSAADNLFDFNWQIPANAAAFFALAGLVMGAGRFLDPAGERDLE
jgi:O-antigen ligase